jgi:hypothetical protein
MTMSYLMSTRNWAWSLVILTGIIGANRSAFAQSAGTLNGTVFDLSRAVIPKSVIILYWNPPGNKMSWNGVPKLTNKSPRKKGLAVTADGNGQFSVKLFPGVWDVFVHADGLFPICEVVTVEAGKAQNIELHFTRLVSPMIE